MKINLARLLAQISELVSETTELYKEPSKNQAEHTRRNNKLISVRIKLQCKCMGFLKEAGSEEIATLSLAFYLLERIRADYVELYYFGNRYRD